MEGIYEIILLMFSTAFIGTLGIIIGYEWAKAEFKPVPVESVGGVRRHLKKKRGRPTKVKRSGKQ